MSEFIQVALEFPTAVWTIALALAVLYWLLVALAGVDVDIAGGADGGLEGIAEAGAEGASEAVAEAGAAVKAAAAAGLLQRLQLRSVPVTVLVSVLVVVNFFLCHLASFTLGAFIGRFLPPAAWAALLLLGVFIASLPLASLLVRPLAPLFRTHEAPSRLSLVGKEVAIFTGRVDESFGQARYEDGGAGMVIEVRAPVALAFKRGERALIISFDQARDAFEISRLDDILNRPPSP